MHTIPALDNCDSDTVNKIFKELLGIPDIQIISVKIDQKNQVIVTVKSTLTCAECHKCGRIICRFHGYDREIMIKHLPIFGRETYICTKLPRYKCTDCDKNTTTTQQVPWRERKSSYTIAYEMHILKELVNSTITDVSVKEGISCDTVTGIVDRYIRADVDWTKFKKISVLGLDEISLKKGHKDFVVIVTGRVDNETVVFSVLQDRKKETVKQFLSTIPKDLRKTIQMVCSDMYEGFINAAKEVLKRNVKIVIDRFHVAKLYRKGFDTLRKQEIKRLKKELSEQEYKKLKGVMWALRKKKNDLTKEQNNLLECLFEHSPKLKTAYELSNELTCVFDKHILKESARKAMKRWIKKVKESTLNCFNTFTETLNKWMNEIINYFVKRQTSGFVEGVNNKIKVIKRRCYGILNITHLYQRICIDFSRYNTSLFC